MNARYVMSANVFVRIKIQLLTNVLYVMSVNVFVLVENTDTIKMIFDSPVWKEQNPEKF